MARLTTHPALLLRRMTCKKIMNVTCSDHGTYLVEYEPHVYTLGATGELVAEPATVLDCASLFDITTEPERGVIFGFTKYFTDETKAELHAAFERGEYDYLGLPEF